ncbi:MAG: response regulator [Thalassotalea sp.]
MSKKIANTHSWLITSLIFVIGLATTAFLYQTKKAEKIIKAQNDFKLEASLRAKDIQSEFMRSFFQVSSIANLFASSNWVSHQEFTNFLTSVFPVFPEGRRLSVINHTEVEALDDVIEKIAANPEPQYQQFEVFDLIDGKKITPARSFENAYNFVQYAYPAPDQADFYGRNLRPDSPIGPRLYKVIVDANPLISDISKALPGILEKPFFLHMQPVLKHNNSGEKSLSGIIVSSQQIEDVFNSETIKQTLNIFNYQILDQNGNRYDYPQKQFYFKDQIPAAKENTFAYTNTIDIVGGQWQLNVFPTELLNERSAELLQNLYVSGILLSLFFAIITHLIINQRRKLTHEVAQKTAQLNAAMLELNKNNVQLITAVESSEKSAKIKAEFLANMSHEIRTPLNGVYGFLQLLLKTKLDTKQVDFLNNMENSVKHLMSVINDILDFSKIEAGKIVIESTPFSIHKVIDFLHSSVEQIAKAKGLTFNVNILTELNPDLLGDIVRVKQVLLNLCSNAIKFTEQGDVVVNISMFLTETDDLKSPVRITFEVVDSGIGLKPDEVAGLFQAFMQADTSTTRRFGGTGLGLTISQKLCQLMGGEITVKSTFGVGSHFTASMTFDQNTEIIESADLDKKFEQPVSILLVDDNPMAINALELHLKNMNTKVWSSQSCIEALEHLQRHPNKYDVVITDWTMKEMNGGTFLNKILALNIVRKPKFIVLTAYDLSVIENATPNLTIAAILQKPCLDSRLFAAIENAIYQQESEGLSDKQSLDGLRILVAEDNRINQVVINTMLKSENVEVVITENGEKCIEQLCQPQHFDLILMDIHMPVLDGIQATQQIRALADKKLASIPIIALTANVMKEDVENYLTLGINAHAAKPVEFNALKITILTLLAESERVS